MTTTTEVNFYKKVVYRDEPGFAQEFANDLKNNKLVHFCGLPEGTDYMKFYENLVDQIGNVLIVDEDALSGNSTANRWTDIRYDVDFATKTFRHSNTRQPLHTDAAYTNFDQDVNFFFCLVSSEVGGYTTFIDSVELVAILKKYYAELYEKLTTTEVVFNKGENQRKVRKIIAEDARGLKMNWNHFRISDENSQEVKDMCDEFHEFLETRVVEGGLLTGVRLEPGECVFFHDDRLLHGRTSFIGSRNLIKGGFNFKN